MSQSKSFYKSFLPSTSRPFTMGSIDKAMLTGFICRLCSEMHKVVIHIYGDEGQRLGLSSKINKYLPVNVSHSDPLPKTICNTCLGRLEGQHRLMLQIERVRKRLHVPRETRHAVKKKKKN